MLSLKEENELIAKSVAGCRQSEDKLLRNNAKTIKSIAYKVYRSYGSGRDRVNYDDLVQEGFKEFIRVLRLNKFDLEYGVRFISFTGRSIKNKMWQVLCQSHKHCSTPKGVNEINTIVSATAQRYFQEHGEWPSDELLRDRIGCSDERFKCVKEHRYSTCFRLDQPISNNGLEDSNEGYDIIGATPQDIEDTIFNKNVKARLDRCLSLLEEREKEIILQVFDKDLTFAEIGESRGLSRQRVHQIYKNGMKTIRHLMLKTPELIELEKRDERDQFTTRKDTGNLSSKICA